MKRKFLGMLLAGALAAGAGALGTMAMAASDHAHEQGATAHELKLNAGKKWASDEPLRQSMAKIRDAVDARLPAAHRDTLGADQYDSLGGEIEAQIGNIVRNCKLDPEADEVLHVILAGMSEANDAMRGKDATMKRRDGLVKVVGVLEQYADHFEHPGWTAPRAGH